MPSRKVLIVEDEAGVRELLASAIESAGYEALTAEDGLDGLEAAKWRHPDIILLDISMPKMDGWKTLTSLRQEPRTSSIPVAMLTGHGETSSLMKSEEQHVLEYFIKPVVIEDLLKFLKRFFDLNAAG